MAIWQQKILNMAIRRQYEVEGSFWGKKWDRIKRENRIRNGKRHGMGMTVWK